MAEGALGTPLAEHVVLLGAKLLAPLLLGLPLFQCRASSVVHDYAVVLVKARLNGSWERGVAKRAHRLSTSIRGTPEVPSPSTRVPAARPSAIRAASLACPSG